MTDLPQFVVQWNRTRDNQDIILLKDGELIATYDRTAKERYYIENYWLSAEIRKQFQGQSSYSYKPVQWVYVYDEGKTPKPEDFHLDLECYHWSCGDGCCSDSGYKGILYYHTYGFKHWQHWHDNRNEDSIISSALKHIEYEYGLKLTRSELKINRSDRYSDDDYDE